MVFYFFGKIGFCLGWTSLWATLELGTRSTISIRDFYQSLECPNFPIYIFYIFTLVIFPVFRRKYLSEFGHHVGAIPAIL